MNTSLHAMVAGVLLLGLQTEASAQKAGQSTTIQYGTVVAVREVELKSAAVPTSAVVGGALGLASASGKSKGRKARNTILGATAGGTIASASQGSQRGMSYQVQVGGGGVVQVVSDQQEIRSGDCVAVEKVGETANIRRVSASYCDKANEVAVKSVAAEARKDAEECAAAKHQLVNATTTQAADLAGRKVSLLCND